MGPDALERFQTGEQLPSGTSPTPLVNSLKLCEINYLLAGAGQIELPFNPRICPLLV